VRTDVLIIPGIFEDANASFNSVFANLKGLPFKKFLPVRLEA
jgi:hypothetical protein